MSVEKIWRLLNKTDSPYPTMLAWIFAAIPALSAAALIAGSTANCPTNDYSYLMPRIGKMLEPGYDWLGLARDSSMSSHCLLVPMFFHLLNMWLLKWNITFELYLGLLLAFARVVLIDKMISPSVSPSSANGARPGQRSILSALVLVAISALSFGAANVSVMLYNLTAVAYGITFLFFILGLWALYRFENSTKGLLLMVLFGFLSSFSNGGSAMFSWICYGFYVLLQPAKNRLWGLATCAVSFIACMGAISYLVHSGGIESYTIKPHIPDVKMFLQCFALPFLTQTTAAITYSNPGLVIGAAAWLIAAFLLFILIKKRFCSKSVAFCLILALFAALNTIAVSAFRFMVAPWYDAFAALFWIAIIGVAVNLATRFQPGAEAQSPGEAASPIQGEAASPIQDQASPGEGQATIAPGKGNFSAGRSLALACLPLCLVYILFFCSNLSYRDKDSFRDSHCPATETAMRHFTTAPTYAEANLFSFSIGEYRRVKALCEPLARHGLAAFGTGKHVLLQGDFLLPDVTVHVSDPQSDVYWIDGQSTRKHHQWSEPQHLNLALAGKSSLSWPVEISPRARESFLLTKYALASSKKNHAGVEQTMTGTLQIIDKKTHLPVYAKPLRAKANQEWQPVRVDLLPYKGSAIEVRLTGDNKTSQANEALVFESPQIALTEFPQPELPPTEVFTLKPANTELSSDFRGPDQEEYLWSLNENIWDLNSLDRISPDQKSKDSLPDSAKFKVTKSLSSVTYKPALEIPLTSVDRFYIEIAVPEKIRPRAVCCQMVLNGNYLRQIFIPLLDDAQMHRYTFDLKLCNFSSKEKIMGFKVLPIFNVEPVVEPGKDCIVGLGKIGFLKP